jgi:hypothetical protein
MMQMIVVILVIAGALGYAAWRAYRTLRSNTGPCCGCEMKKNCQKFGQFK